MTAGAGAPRGTFAPPIAGPTHDGARAVVVGSGKGGVGKSVLSVLLAAAWARTGRNVLLVDGSQNLGNLHVLLDVGPAAPLEELARGDLDAKALIRPVAPNLWLLPAASGDDAVYALSAVDRSRVHYRVSRLFDGFDVVVVDAAPGIESVVRAGTMGGGGLLVVVTPEVTALTDAFALIRIVTLHLPQLPIGVIGNRVPPDVGRVTFDRLDLATRQVLHRRLVHLGTIPDDPVLRAAAAPRSVLLGEPSGGAAAAMGRLVVEGAGFFAPILDADRGREGRRLA